MKGAEKLVSIYTNVQFSEVLLSSEWKFKVRCYVTNKWAIYKAQRAGCTVFWILASMFSCPYIWFLFNDRARIHWKIAFICFKKKFKIGFFSPYNLHYIQDRNLTFALVAWQSGFLIPISEFVWPFFVMVLYSTLVREWPTPLVHLSPNFCSSGYLDPLHNNIGANSTILSCFMDAGEGVMMGDTSAHISRFELGM